MIVTRTLRFALFTLIEYVRSGRILIEVLVVAAAYYLFFRDAMDSAYFFTYAGLCAVLLMLITATSIMGLGDRLQGYIVLMRRLGRGGYLIGLYLAALLVGIASYSALSLLVALFNHVSDLTFLDWLRRSIPLVLNIALLSALLTLLSPIVLTVGWRLLTLAIVALAFSGNLISGQTLQDMPDLLQLTIQVLRTIAGTPLLPAFAGFTLAVTGDYSGANVAIVFSQAFLTLSLLALALYAFSRRELIFSGS